MSFNRKFSVSSSRCPTDLWGRCWDCLARAVHTPRPSLARLARTNCPAAPVWTAGPPARGWRRTGGRGRSRRWRAGTEGKAGDTPASPQWPGPPPLSPPRWELTGSPAHSPPTLSPWSRWSWSSARTRRADSLEHGGRLLPGGWWVTSVLLSLDHWHCELLPVQGPWHPSTKQVTSTDFLTLLWYLKDDSCKVANGWLVCQFV